MNLGESGKPVIAAQHTWIAKLASPDGFLCLWLEDQRRSLTDGVEGSGLQYCLMKEMAIANEKRVFEAKSPAELAAQSLG